MKQQQQDHRLTAREESDPSGTDQVTDGFGSSTASDVGWLSMQKV
jgi:hypothetical protein